MLAPDASMMVQQIPPPDEQSPIMGDLKKENKNVDKPMISSTLVS